MSRVLIVSNRLPVTVQNRPEGLLVERSSGGLATGLKATHEMGGGVWVGWPGFAGEIEPERRDALHLRYRALRVAPVSLSKDEVERYYEAYCNGLLWPLFHSFVGQLPLEAHDFPLYRAVNQKFADAVVAHYQPGDHIWVHDYQLMLVPRLLRERLPHASIGFFLHIPFPPSDTFRTLPAREELLAGLLGADLIGFHTASYMRNFISSAIHVLGASSDVDRLSWQGRTSNLGVFPMGIDSLAFQRLAESDEVSRLMEEFRGPGRERLLVGIDRLDYTKGIPRRLLAYEQLLSQHPELCGQVRLVQVAVPSRTKVEAYAEFRHQVDALVGRINGRFGSPGWAPVHYLYRNLSEAQVVALYRAADTMLVTPIRDGMNLVAKEFVASRSDDQGVLVLSEFAGAASELGEALHVNPYDIESSARVYHRALQMGDEERRTRMRALRLRVMSHDVHGWASGFVQSLAQCSQRVDHQPTEYASADQIGQAVGAMRAAQPLVLLLDYDGTLVPIADTPDLASPDETVLALLSRLAARPSTQVHVISGRGRDVIDGWLGHLPIGIHAEHGFWSRSADGTWRSSLPTSDAWRPRAREILEDFAARTPGSLVEQKRSGIAWHYRMADPEYGAFQANELKLHLSSLLSNEPVEVLTGDKVIELRPHGAHKGRVVASILEGLGRGMLPVAFGDDRTDEDLFAALPEPSLSLHIGPSPSRARLRLRSVSEVRSLLAALL